MRSIMKKGTNMLLLTMVWKSEEIDVKCVDNVRCMNHANQNSLETRRISQVHLASTRWDTIVHKDSTKKMSTDWTLHRYSKAIQKKKLNLFERNSSLLRGNCGKRRSFFGQGRIWRSRATYTFAELVYAVWLIWDWILNGVRIFEFGLRSDRWKFK